MFCFTALITPSGTPNRIEKTSARPASFAVIGMRGRISVERRLLGDVGIAEIAAQQAADPGAYCTGIGLSRPSSASISGLVRRIDHAGGIEQDVDDVAGHDAQQHEDDHRDPEQGQEHQQEAPDQIGTPMPPPINRAEEDRRLSDRPRIDHAGCGYLSSQTSSKR